MKHFLLFAIMVFALGLSFSAQAQFSMGETPPPPISLPVTLSSFTANVEGGSVKLVWRTETEINNIGFTIYRSEAKDSNYTRITFVNGAGSTGMPIFTYNVQGRVVRRLELGKQSAGSYVTKDKAAYWDGKDDRGKKVASGVYWYTFRAGDFDATRRMVIVK
jgi:hypothetical protein